LISANKYTPTAQYFSVLKKIILDKDISKVGGVPQMVKLSLDNSQPVGFNWLISNKMESTLFGMPLAFSSDMSKIQFMDDNFHLSKYLRSGHIRRSSL